MYKKDLIKAISQRTGQTQQAVALFLNSFQDVIVHELSCGNSVQLVSFGTFKTRILPERFGIVPSTGDVTSYPELRVPMFKAGTRLKNKVGGK